MVTIDRIDNGLNDVQTARFVRRTRTPLFVVLLGQPSLCWRSTQLIL